MILYFLVSPPRALSRPAGQPLEVRHPDHQPRHPPVLLPARAPVGLLLQPVEQPGHGGGRGAGAALALVAALPGPEAGAPGQGEGGGGGQGRHAAPLPPHGVPGEGDRLSHWALG